jgi:maltooligosyltrehalose trehalohydrolase
VHAIHDESARPFLGELAQGLHELGGALGRHVHVIAESDANDPRLVRGADQGGLGLDAVWNDDFHHAIHSALTGEARGYYVDFGGLAPVAKAFRDRFVFDGAYSRHRQRRHGAVARDVPGDCFVTFVQNHDQVGNRAGGERLAGLVPPARLRLAAALLLLAPGLPLLFMGEEHGATEPFWYFVDHGDAALLEAVREGRRSEFGIGGSDVPDPGDPATFERSRPCFEQVERPAGARLLALYRELLRLRRQEPALGARVDARVEGEPEVGWFLALRRPPSGPAALAAFHLGPEPREVAAPVGASGWRLALTTEDAAFGGPGSVARPRLGAEGRLLLPPDAALLYLEEGS